jgi:predicted GIY-YIG superfamily endonuclease
MQMLLFPDPRPLVERLGVDFFRQAPESAGVYLMRDAADKVLYVGKAKNLRKRLAHYRVANPDRLARRHLRLLRAVTRIELEECPTESAALEREAGLLLGLRPRFNRAGTWAGAPRFFGWRAGVDGVELAIGSAPRPGWVWFGPFGMGVVVFRESLVRLLWCALDEQRGLAQLPLGWFWGRHPEVAQIRGAPAAILDAKIYLGTFSSGRSDEFAAWVRERVAVRQHPFEVAALEEDLETVCRWIEKRRDAARIEVDPV